MLLWGVYVTCGDQSIQVDKFAHVAQRSVADKQVIHVLAKGYVDQGLVKTPQDALYKAYLEQPEIAQRAAERMAVAYFTHQGIDKHVDGILDDILAHVTDAERALVQKIVRGDIKDLRDKDDKILERAAYMKAYPTCEFKKLFHTVSVDQWADWTQTYTYLDHAQQKYCFEKYLTKVVRFMIDYPLFAATAYQKMQSARQ
jgi:hypothetical protein